MAATKNPLIVVKSSKIQGRGVFAARDISPETKLIEYVGERISTKEADRRYDDEAMERHHTMLFTVDSKTCIDAAVHGNDARFINHSCKPNCEARQEGKRIFIHAIAPIAKGKELVYDYRYTCDDSVTEAEAKKLYPCYCGHPECRGTIIDFPAKRAAKKKKTAKKKASTKVLSKKKSSTKVSSKKKASTKVLSKKKSLKRAR